jgi:hypothetical protein
VPYSVKANKDLFDAWKKLSITVEALAMIGRSIVQNDMIITEEQLHTWELELDEAVKNISHLTIDLRDRTYKYVIKGIIK